MKSEYEQLRAKRLELAKLQQHASDSVVEQHVLAVVSLGDEFALLAAWETEVRAQFIQARLDALPAVERPPKESVPTLASLLLERIVALKRKMLEPGGDEVLFNPREGEPEIVSEERRRFAGSVADARAHQARVQAIPTPGDDATEEQIRGYEAARADFFLALEQAFKNEHRLELALVWGDAWREWRKANPLQRVRIPPALMTGPGALASYFGHKLVGRVGRPNPGRIDRIVVRNNKTQLELMRPGLLELEDPSDNALYDAISGVLTNRTWRMFICCFAAAQQDMEMGRTPLGAFGSFLYTPTRYGELMGLPRVGKQQRIEARYYPAMDKEMAALSQVSFTATVSRGGKPYDLHADKLVFYGHATIKPTEPERAGRRAGRRAAEVWSFNSVLLQLIDTTAGGYYCSIPISALATPRGMDPRVWDDAFKVYTLLSAHARVNAAGAHTEGSVPWARLLTGLLDLANITGPGIPDRKQRARGLALLGALQKAGLVRFELEGDGAEGLVRYDLPAGRSELVKVPSPRRPLPKAKRPKAIPG